MKSNVEWESSELNWMLKKHSARTQIGAIERPESLLCGSIQIETHDEKNGIRDPYGKGRIHDTTGTIGCKELDHE